MRATVIHGPRDVRVEQVPDPVIHRPTDAVVRVVAWSVRSPAGVARSVADYRAAVAALNASLGHPSAG